MLNQTVIAALLVLTPLIWSMSNENTVLVKSLATGLFAAAVVLTADRTFRSWVMLRAAAPAHALLAFGIISAAMSPSPSFAWPATIVSLTLWIVAAAASALPPDFWRRTVLLAATIPVIFGALQICGWDPTAWGPIVRDHFHGRICSTLGNPNFYAAYLVGVLPFVVWGFAVAADGRRILMTGFGIATLAALLFTGSKGGAIGLIAAAAAFLFAVRHGKLLRSLPRLATPRTVAALAFILVIILVAMPARTRERLFFTTPETGATAGATSIVRNESVRFRILTWTQTLRMVREATICGHGIGRFQVVYPRYRLPEIIRMFGQHSYMTDHPENLSIEIVAELGIVGLGLWLWLLACVAKSLMTKLKAPNPQERWLAGACTGALSGIMVTNSFGVDIHYGATAVLAACLLGTTLSRGVVEQNPRLTPLSVGRPGPVRWALTAAALLLALAWTRTYASDAALARALGNSTRASWGTAIASYRQAITLNPTNVMARYFGASALLDRGGQNDLAEARDLLDGVRREAPDYVLLNYKYWLLYNKLRLAHEARGALERQIRLDPLAAVFYLERGRLALDEKRWEDAHGDFETAIRVEPKNPAGYQYLGNMMVVRGRLSDALATYGRGLARNPESMELHYNAAVAALKLGDMRQARAHAGAVLRKDPRHAQARLIMSKAVAQ